MEEHSESRARLVALDWGTTSCRAYLLGDNGVVLAERREPLGILAVTKRAAALDIPVALAYEQTFESLCGDWLALDSRLPAIASGMVGSTHGWIEAEYRAVPADLAAGGTGLTEVRTTAGNTVHIIPGLIADSGLPDVMRGEETQILGALTEGRRTGTLDRAADRIVLLPGTHSKWVRTTGTTVTDFTTFMTGEVYALLMKDSTLSLLATHRDRPDWGAFERGLDVAASPDGGGGFLATAFSARTLVMTGSLAPDQVEDYLSGLLIGHELEGIVWAWLRDDPHPIVLCGNLDLNDRYRRAAGAPRTAGGTRGHPCRAGRHVAGRRGCRTRLRTGARAGRRFWQIAARCTTRR